MSASKTLVMEESTVNIKKFTKIKRYLKTFNIFYVGISFACKERFGAGIHFWRRSQNILLALFLFE